MSSPRETVFRWYSPSRARSPSSRDLPPSTISSAELVSAVFPTVVALVRSPCHSWSVPQRGRCPCGQLSIGRFPTCTRASRCVHIPAGGARPSASGAAVRRDLREIMRREGSPRCTERRLPRPVSGGSGAVQPGSEGRFWRGPCWSAALLVSPAEVLPRPQFQRGWAFPGGTAAPSAGGRCSQDTLMGGRWALAGQTPVMIEARPRQTGNPQGKSGPAHERSGRRRRRPRTVSGDARGLGADLATPRPTPRRTSSAAPRSVAASRRACSCPSGRGCKPGTPRGRPCRWG